MIKPSKHIVFLCSRLDLPGGTERAIVNTANLLCSNGHKVSLLVLDITDRSFYPLHPKVRVVKADLHFGITRQGMTLTRKIAFVRHILQLKKIIRALAAPIVISTDYVFTIAARIALRKATYNIYAWEHHHFYWLTKNRFWTHLQKKVYPTVEAVICLNRREAMLYERIGCKTIVIPNYVAQSPECADLSQRSLLTIGWLNHRKGVDLIPEIAEAIFKRFPLWHWKIIGEGEEYEVLKKFLANKKLEAHVQIIQPATPDIKDMYKTASVYVMLSRFECFPMVLLEAMSFGLPCIAFDCPTGPAEIIENGVDGILVESENKTAMIAAINELMQTSEKRKQMGAAAYTNVARFAPERIYALWENLLNGI